MLLLLGRLLNLLQLLLAKLVTRQPLELADGDALDVTCVHQVVHTRVLGVAVHEAPWVHVLHFDPVVRVVGSLGYRHPDSGQVRDAAAVRVVVEVVPLQRHVRRNLCGDFGVGLDVGLEENLCLLECFRKLFRVVPDSQSPCLLLECNQLVAGCDLHLHHLLLLILLRRGQRVDSL